MPLPAPGPDRTAVVTGASSGIGVEIARDLARRGHHVTLVARTVSKLEDLAAELSDTGAAVVPCDLADRASRATLLDRVTAEGRVADVLVNSAGGSTFGLVAASDAEAEMGMVELDVMAIVDLCSRFVPGMVERGRGGVLNVASMGAFTPVPGQSGYGASKAFVLSYTTSLVGELHGTGVSASTLCPGPVKTGFGDRAGFSDAEAEKAMPKFMWVSPAEVARIGVAGLDGDKLYTVPGAANRIAASISMLTPRRLLLPALRKSHPAFR